MTFTKKLLFTPFGGRGQTPGNLVNHRTAKLPFFGLGKITKRDW